MSLWKHALSHWLRFNETEMFVETRGNVIHIGSRCKTCGEERSALQL